MPATVIAERIGWTGGITVLKGRIAELRPAYLPPDRASRTGDAAGPHRQAAVGADAGSVALSAFLRFSSGPPRRQALPARAGI